MAFRTGDIDDLYDWSDDDRADEQSVASLRPEEEQRVGTQASFEQLLERELAKEQAQHGSAASTREATATAKPTRPFLKKGARGWWMENPTAKQKMHKHVLESVEVDESNQAAHQRHARPQAKAPSKQPGGRRSPQASSSVGTASPEPVRREDVAPVQISPVRVSPTARRGDRAFATETPRRRLPMWASANPNVRTSVETLNMSGVRHEFESRREREANELADFEALEQELAAEKESYLQEKIATGDRYSRSQNGESEEASWLRESGDGAGNHEESRHLLSRAFRSSYSNLDLGGESSMVFEGDYVFKSPMPRAPIGHSAQRIRQSRPSFAPSEISAVSLDDSEPWGDGNMLEHFSNLPESPIPKRDATSSRLSGMGGSRSANAIDINGGRGSGSQQYGDESSGYYDDFDEDLLSEPRSSLQGRDGNAPVSSLVQQVFGGPRQVEDMQNGQAGYTAIGRRSRLDSGVSAGKSGAKHSNIPPPKQSRTTHGRKQPNPKQRMKDEPPAQDSRRRTPALGSAVLPVPIEEKLAELEEEVKFYKSETLQLQRKKAQYDEEIQRFAREKENIAQYQDEQRQLIAQEWQQQRQKMKHEERMFERQMKLKLSAAASAGSRKDRAEIDALKAQIVALQLEAKQSSSKMKATNDVLRQRISELEGKNRELSEEIKFLERDRLDQWQKYEDLLKELNSQKLKQDHDGDHLKTVADVSRVGRSAEQFLSSFKSPVSDVRRSRDPGLSESAASTPAFERTDEYNPGRYRQAENGFTGSTHSSHSSDKQMKEDGIQGRCSSSSSVGDATAVDEVVHPGGKREITYRDGTKRIFFADGNEKEILPNGNVVIRFTNGDRKEFFPSTGVSVYHYHEAQTKLTTYPDKTKVYEFPNQQIEKSYPDGTTEIQFADGIMKTIRPSGDEFSRFPDGTTMLETTDGLREVTLLNGKKVRYYPDGKMTMLNLDGQESEVRSDEELRELMENA